MSKEYTGWKLFDNIIIVKSAHKSYKYGCQQGYIVEPGNKKQLESAKHWGGRSVYNTDDEGNYIKDEAGNYVVTYEEAEVIETHNSGFKLTLLDCAGGSSQGGKLSFWNCLIEKDGDKYVVGINSELLLELMLQSTFTNGVCDKELCFARKNGNVGVLHTEMTQYQDAIKDMQIKKKVNTKKTSKWQIGSNYVTLNNNDVYFGMIFQPILYSNNYLRIREMDTEVIDKMRAANPDVNDRWATYVSVDTFNIDKARSGHLISEYYAIKRTARIEELSSLTMQEYLESCKKLMDEDYLGWRKRTKRDVVHVDSNIAFNRGDLLKKLPSRTHGDIELGSFESYYDNVEELLQHQKNNLIKLFKERPEYIETSYYLLNEVLKGTSSDVTEVDLELLSKIIESHYKDKNRYELYKVVYGGTEEYLYTREQVLSRIKELLQ